MLLPGRPPARLSLDAPLGATGAVKDGQKHVSRLACFAVAAQACSKAATGCLPGAGRGDERYAGAGGQVWAAAGSMQCLLVRQWLSVGRPAAHASMPTFVCRVVFLQSCRLSWRWPSRMWSCCPACDTAPPLPHNSIQLPFIAQVKLAAAFQDVELLPSRSIGAVPAGDNPALLRCVAHGLNLGGGLGDGCLGAGRGRPCPAAVRCGSVGLNAAGTGWVWGAGCGQWLRVRSFRV